MTRTKERGGMAAQAVTVTGITLRQILLSKRTIIILLLCLIPLVVAAVFATGVRVDNRVMEQEIPDEDKPDDDGIGVEISDAFMDIREEPGGIVIERTASGSAENLESAIHDVDNVALDFNMNVISESTGDNYWTYFGGAPGLTLLSKDSSRIPAEVRAALTRALLDTPEDELGELTGGNTSSLEGIIDSIMGGSGGGLPFRGGGSVAGTPVGDGGAGDVDGTGDGDAGDAEEATWDQDPVANVTEPPVAGTGFLAELYFTTLGLPGGHTALMFGTGPGGINDWSTWSFYAYQRIDDEYRANMRQLGSLTGGLDIGTEASELVANELENMARDVRRGDLRGYVHAEAVSVSGATGNNWAEVGFPEPDPDEDYGFEIFQEVAGNLYLFLIVPLTALLYATVAVTSEITNRTMTYMTSRPMRRQELFTYRFVGYYGATLVVTQAPLVLAFAVFGIPSGAYGENMHILGAWMLVTALYVLVLGSVFFMLASLFNRALIWGLIYMFFWEALMSQTPLAIRLATINFYMMSLLDGLLGDDSMMYVFRPYDLGDSAVAVALIFSLIMALGMWIFSKREYH